MCIFCIKQASFWHNDEKQTKGAATSTGLEACQDVSLLIELL